MRIRYLITFVGLMIAICYSQNLSIAVMDLDPQGGVNKQEAGVLTNRLRSELVRTNKFVVLDRGNMDAILGEMGFQMSGCTSTECAVEMGKLLNVQKMVSGAVGKLGTLYTFDIIFIDIGTGQIEKSITRDYQGEIEGLIKLMQSIARELAGTEQPVAVPETYTLSIQSVPADATVFIDNEEVGRTPFTETYEAGDYGVRLSMNNYQDYNQQVELNQDMQVEWRLQPLEIQEYATKKPKKKLGRRLLFLTTLTAVAGGGAYYYLYMMEEEPAETGFPKPVGRP